MEPIIISAIIVLGCLGYGVTQAAHVLFGRISGTPPSLIVFGSMVLVVATILTCQNDPNFGLFMSFNASLAIGSILGYRSLRA